MKVLIFNTKLMSFLMDNLSSRSIKPQKDKNSSTNMINALLFFLTSDASPHSSSPF